MVRIAISQAAFEAITGKLPFPLGSVSYENASNAKASATCGWIRRWLNIFGPFAARARATATSYCGWQGRGLATRWWAESRLKILATQIGWGAPAGVEPATSPAVGSVCETRSHIETRALDPSSCGARPFLPLFECVEKWLTKILHRFRSETSAGPCRQLTSPTTSWPR
jgi:hypothetical protein